MNAQNLSKFKSIIGAVILLGVLSVSTLSLAVMNHGMSAHHGCLGLGIGTSPCEALADIVSCLRVHLGVLQIVSQAISTYVSQLLVAFIMVVVLWFVVKNKRGESETLSRLRLRLRNLNLGHNILLKKLEQWLILLEKRDPARNVLVVLGVLIMPAR